MTTTAVSPASPRKASNHIGTVGERVRVEGVIRKMFGNAPVMHIIEDLEGNLFILRRGSPLASKTGVLVAIQADVLGHKVHQEIKQTILSAGRQEIITDDHAFLAAKRRA